MKKILFILPRFHTNQVGMILALKNNFLVDIHVSYKGNIENYNFNKPLVLNQCYFSRFLEHIFDPEKSSIRSLCFPNPFHYFYKLFKNKYKLIIVREFFRVNSLIALIYCLIFGNKILFITQTRNINKFFYLKRFLMNFLLLIPNVKWASPTADEFALKPIFLPFCLLPYEKILSKKNQRINILVIGKFGHKRKNLEYFLYQISMLDEKKQIPFLNINIIGSSEKDKNNIARKKLISIIKEKNLINIVNILSDIKHEFMEKYFLEADIFVLPSINEPASISLLEALNYGCFTLSPECNGTARYIDNELYGLLFNHNKKGDFLSKLIFCINNKDKIKNDRFIRSKTFSNKYGTNKFLELFNDILK